MANDLAELLGKWSACASALESILKERNFELFQDCIKEGSDIASRIRRIIDTRSPDVISLKEQLKKTSEKWDILSDEIQIWGQELKKKIKATQDNKIKDKKLNNMYKHLQTTGVSLKVKAK